jgi:DNA-binding IclR family transcriptional regulator
MQIKEKSSYSIRSVEKVLDVLEVISDVKGSFGVTHISEKLGMNKSSVFRLISTLEGRGYIERTHQYGHYKAGMKAFETGQKLLSRMDLLNNAKKVMEELVAECDEDVYLVVPAKKDVVLFDSTRSRHQVQIMNMVGHRFPYTQFSAGKIIFAFNEYRPGDGNEYSRLLDEEICFDHDCICDGAFSMAVPLRDDSGNAVGSICLVAPSYRMTDAVIAGAARKMLLAGRNISTKLGFSRYYLK